MKVVCLGDSLTAGYGVRTEECWVSLLADMTMSIWANAGVTGDSTGGMLARLNHILLSQSPDAVLIMGGVNDILAAGSWECAKPNVTAMVHQCAACGVRPVIGTPIPPHAEAARGRSSLLGLSAAAEKTRSYIEWLRLFSGEFKLRMVDFAAAFDVYSRECGWSRAYFPDGLHPSVAGHRVMAEAAAAQKFFR